MILNESKKLLLNGGDTLNDIFQTTLWDSNQSIANVITGVNMSSGYLLWLKSRITQGDHYLVDSSRTPSTPLRSNTQGAPQVPASGGISINPRGFTVTGAPNSFQNVAWTFKTSSKFFGISRYTGDNSASRIIPHGLNTIPGMIIVKSVNNPGQWSVYHRSLDITNGSPNFLTLESTGSNGNDGRWVDIPNSSSFYLKGPILNSPGYDYVAYLWAHNPEIIQCGSYLGNNSVQEVNLGWEPQYLLIKNVTSDGNWRIYDSKRGIVNGDADKILFANSDVAESSQLEIDTYTNSTSGTSGFRLTGGGDELNGQGRKYIYMAIRT